MLTITDTKAFLDVGKAVFQALCESEQLLSQAQAARIIGVSRQAITGFIRRGTFSTVLVSGRPLLRRAEVQEYAQKTGMKETARRQEKRFDSIFG